jgi:hypothetical protein
VVTSALPSTVQPSDQPISAISQGTLSVPFSECAAVAPCVSPPHTHTHTHTHDTQDMERLQELMTTWRRAKEAPYLHTVVLTTKSLISRVKPLARASTHPF